MFSRKGWQPLKVERAHCRGLRTGCGDLCLIRITQVGDEIVSANNLYGGTYQLFHYTFPKLGRHVTFVDSTRPDEFKKHYNQNESHLCGDDRKSKLDVPDFETISKIAMTQGSPNC